ncbi:hypothetical protein CYCD_26760 [Tenuifilaceae bacterium CYCD]|nr:hypothetical protein CYCD_26760 [Tenuifilaceae bacterium CYCD]
MQNILFGDVEVIDTRTNSVERICRKIFLEHDSINDNNLIDYVLKGKQPKEKQYFKVIRICRESAKVIGVTNY